MFPDARIPLRGPVGRTAWCVNSRAMGPCYSHSFDDHRHRVSAAEAKAHNPAFCVVFLHGVQQRNQYAGSTRTDWVTQRDATAVNVHLRFVQFETTNAGDHLRRECLPMPDLAEISTASEASRPITSSICVLTRSGSAAGKSILLRTVTIS